MYNKILLRYGEIFLKGKNKGNFERKLISNIKKITGLKQVKNLRGRMICDYFENHNNLKKVFGLTSYSPAVQTSQDLKEVEKSLLVLLREKKGKFRVITKRSDKQFPIKSQDVSRQLGIFIEENFPQLEFSLKNYDFAINVEINQEGLFIFFEAVRGFGGLPTGIEGCANLLLKNFEDVVAGLLVMKRGVNVQVLSFGEPKLEFIKLLNKFSPKDLALKELVKIEDLGKFDNSSLIVGQNMKNFKQFSFEKGKKIVVLRPLIAYSNKEIEQKYFEFNTV